jgi:hypothetical protein
MIDLAQAIVDRIAAEGRFMVIDAAHVAHILELADQILDAEADRLANLELEPVDALGVHAVAPAAIEIPAEDSDATPIATLAIDVDDPK